MTQAVLAIERSGGDQTLRTDMRQSLRWWGRPRRRRQWSFASFAAVATIVGLLGMLASLVFSGWASDEPPVTAAAARRPGLGDPAP
jgi:anti-sigma factor RsiW